MVQSPHSLASHHSHGHPINGSNRICPMSSVTLEMDFTPFSRCEEAKKVIIDRTCRH